MIAQTARLIPLTAAQVAHIPADPARWICPPAPVLAGTYDVRCSAGTYVRTLVADIGERLGCGAHLTGRNLNLFVIVIGIVRLMLGGGIL